MASVLVRAKIVSAISDNNIFKKRVIVKQSIRMHFNQKDSDPK